VISFPWVVPNHPEKQKHKSKNLVVDKFHHIKIVTHISNTDLRPFWMMERRAAVGTN
jgi:hypothetical protein